MKHLLKFNEHILSSVENSDHFFNKINLLTTSDLVEGEFYKYRKKIDSGQGKGNTLSALVKFIKVDNNKNYHFRIIKVLTPNLGRLLNFKNDDIIISSASDITKYFSLK
jgi:hypothetical protein